MKEVIDSLLRAAFEKARQGGELKTSDLPFFVVEVPKDSGHGDLASNLALVLARPEKRSPRQIAEILVRHLPASEDLVEASIAGPGFLNFQLSLPFWRRCLAAAIGAGEGYGRVPAAHPRRVQVEFVSANPTGPLTVGHGRNAVLGDTLARLLERRGHQVTREYYFNNAGRQMTVLGESVRARYLEKIGRPSTFPEGGYQGDYIREIAAALETEHGAALADGSDLAPFRAAAEQAIFADIRATLDRMAVHFDVHFNEDSLYRDGSVERTLGRLRAADQAYDRDGAVWLRMGDPGLVEDDKVLVKSSGEPAYRLTDIAYHENKLARGFDWIVDVFGADHIAQHEEVKAGLRALGHDTTNIQAVIYQFVTLLRAGQQVKMSTRRAEYVTLDELLTDVGADVVRFLFLTRKSDTHLEFDLDLARKQSMENPVYYVQYAHARISNILQKAAAVGLKEGAGAPPLERLGQDDEMALVRRIVEFPDVIAEAADELEPHRVTFYLLGLAAAFHGYYNRRENRVVSEDAELSLARLALVRCVQQVLRSGLDALGVSAPERM